MPVDLADLEWLLGLDKPSKKQRKQEVTMKLPPPAPVNSRPVPKESTPSNYDRGDPRSPITWAEEVLLKSLPRGLAKGVTGIIDILDDPILGLPGKVVANPAWAAQDLAELMKDPKSANKTMQFPVTTASQAALDPVLGPEEEWADKSLRLTKRGAQLAGELAIPVGPIAKGKAVAHAAETLAGAATGVASGEIAAQTLGEDARPLGELVGTVPGVAGAAVATSRITRKSPKLETNAEKAAKELFPEATITSGYRGPSHPLSKKNPTSYHATTEKAVDMLPVKGMTFAEAKQRFRNAGYNVLPDSRNEVGKGRSRYATGDHWHFVIEPANGHIAPDGIPGNQSVRPMAPEEIARIMDDPEAAGLAPDESVASGSLRVGDEVADDAGEISDAAHMRMLEDNYWMARTLNDHARMGNPAVFRNYDTLKQTMEDQLNAIRAAIREGVPEGELAWMRDTAKVLENTLIRLGEGPSIPRTSAADKVVGQGEIRQPDNDPVKADLWSFLKRLFKDERGAVGYGDEPPYGGGRQPPEPPETPVDPKYAGSINLNRMAINDDAKEYLRAMAKDFDVSIQTHDETKTAASQLIDQHGIDGILKMEQMRPEDVPAYNNAVRAINASAISRFTKLAKDSTDPEKLTPLLELQLEDARLLALAAADKADGVSGLAGRILEAQKIVVGNDATTKGINKLIREMANNNLDTLDIAKLVAAHPEKAADILRDSLKPKAEDFLMSLWYNWKLSGLTTQAANTLGTATHILAEEVAGALTQPPGMTAARAYGLYAGLKQAVTRSILHEGKKRSPVGVAFKLGTPLDLKSRVEMGRIWVGPGIKGKLGVLEVPTRTLAAVDEFWRNVATSAQLYGDAWMTAAKEGLTGEDFANRVIELTDNPTREMTDRAIEWGKRARFADKPSGLTQALANARHVKDKTNKGERALSVLVRSILPFTWTLDRLTATAVRYSPLGMAERVTREGIAKGGADRRKAIARMIMGTTLVAGVWMAAVEDGTFTGQGPGDYRKRYEKEAAGWRQHAIKIGEHYYSVRTLQPFSTILATTATAVEQWYEDGNDKSFMDKIVRVGKRSIGALLSGAWTDSLTNFYKTTDPGSNSAFANWVGSFFDPTPNIVRQFNQAYIDPAERDTTGSGSFTDRVGGRIASGIPGLSKTLPQKHDVYGRPKTREGALGPDVASPLKVTSADQKKIIQELQRLSGNRKSALVGPPQRKIGDRYLHAKEYQKYQALSGTFFMQGMKDALFETDYATASDAEKREIVKKVLSNARKDAREFLGISAVDKQTMDWLKGLK